MNSFLSSVVFIAIVCWAAAQTGTKYDLMPYGFNRCGAKFTTFRSRVSENDMASLADSMGADGFTYQSSLRYGYVLSAPYNRSCKSPSNQSWPLYLSRIPYDEMPYGFNACPRTFGPLRRGVTQADMEVEASSNGFDGFTYQWRLQYGRVLTRPYNRTCQSPKNLSWPLFLTPIKYYLAPFGFNGCSAQFGPNQQGVSKDHMARLASDVGADGFTYQPNLRYGAVLTKPYNRSCQSDPSLSWPLYLKNIDE